ncbi:apolipoprotein L domain-containing protein 1 [Hemicordylus capensis]|uniref:apolipoprotein L domain-containing protein 1 n=1 Tax=Hemicordylus capensis TaxID=884348 RepID=UPI0023034DA7|nr:apolipoprotein L domain-containing protein 1 [Hemicordylus capensis]XP_053107385.1 apolipoprotein L domain-containing protein 1 [Hemicordylus capensis]XP_053107386.1 apolipoprotein L domain-containing protein 1 [Hemicordylus capensis]
MEWHVSLPTLDSTRHFHYVLLAQRGQLRDHIKNLHEISRRINKLHRRSLIANFAGSSLSAAGAITAIVGLSLSPATLGASLLASGVGLGVAAAGGAVTVTWDLSSALSNSREVKRVKEIALACHSQMRELMHCLEFLHCKQGTMDITLQQAERNACVALYNSICFMVFCGSQGFLVPEHTEEVTKASHVVLKAKVQKLAENLEACARPMDEICELLETRKEFPWKTRTPASWDGRHQNRS